MVEGTRLVVLLDLLNACRWQDGLSEGLAGDILVEVCQVALALYSRNKWRLDSLL